MAKMQRDKGMRGERELLGLLSEQLGTVVQRNLVQTRDSGADSLSIPGFSIEVKRQETPFRQAWWDQVNATRTRTGVAPCKGVIPVLFYRQSRHPWTAVFDLADIYPNVDAGSLCHTDLPTICQLIREEYPHVRHEEKAVA
ncbi:hypothetical protein [Acidithiobacillus ferriphilus]|uniref:hypothetical protein n=1 Tax=Acidithiobacillus ferriphilus TaxID=1689834 RepID=UPI001C07571C|nr:hypothetical protein [Acidithiobacillus ferriphilus]MBU2852916.1 hypothetical protein [Acidithiobacillus ferriphilus]